MASSSLSRVKCEVGSLATTRPSRNTTTRSVGSSRMMTERPPDRDRCRCPPEGRETARLRHDDADPFQLLTGALAGVPLGEEA